MPVLRSQKQITDALARYPLIQRVFDLSAEQNLRAYLVGGTVRDLLIGQTAHDLDFVVQGSGLTLARYVADQLGGYFHALDRERLTGRVLLPRPNRPQSTSKESPPTSAPQYLDIAALRGDDLQADLAGRDFTLNAIAIAREQNGDWRICDPLNGHQDLSRSILRMASPSSFDDDPVRTLRAVRMQIQFNCRIEPQTRECLRAAVSLLHRVSAERVRDEWFKILQLERAADALGEMTQLGLLQEVSPEIAHSPKLDHALETVRAVERLWAALNAPPDQPRHGSKLPLGKSLQDLGPHIHRRYTSQICDERSYLAMLKCAALLHPIGDGGTASAVRWRLSKRESELLNTTVQYYPDVGALADPDHLDRRAIYRFFVQTGEPGIDAALLYLAHTLAAWNLADRRENWTHQTKTVARLLEAWFKHRDTLVSPIPLLSGKDVMRVLDQPPGPQIGTLLQSLTEEQAAGEVLTRQQAIEYIQAYKTRRENDRTRKQ